MARTRIEVITNVLEAVNIIGLKGATRVQYEANIGYKRCKIILKNLVDGNFITEEDDAGRNRRLKEYKLTKSGIYLLNELKAVVSLIQTFEHLFEEYKK